MSKSEYRSNRSVAQTPKLLISVDDPRLAWDQIALTKATLGADFDIVGLDGKLIVEGGTTPGNPSGAAYTTSSSGGNNYSPPSIGKPSINLGYDAIVPADITNLDTTWDGEDLVVTFDWDPDDPANATVSEFVLEVTADGITRQTPYGSFVPDKTQTEQTIRFTKSINRTTIGVFRTSITSVCVKAMDPFFNVSSNVCDTSIPAYVLDLPVPEITVAPAISGYNVSYTIPTQSSFDAINIFEYESNSSSEPTNVVYSRIYFGNVSPANVITLNTNSRWIKASFSSDGGNYTAFSAAQKVTPLSPVTIDNVGPSNVTSVTATTGIDTSGYLGFNAYADISWQAVNDSTLRGYRIRFSNDGGTTFSYVNSPGAGTTYRLGGLAIGSTYKIAIATYDEFNNTSSNYIPVSPDVTVTGTPSISNYIEAGPFQFGIGVGNVSSNKGIFLNSSNYWYIDSSSSAQIKVGGNQNNYISWDGQVFTIDGNITARQGFFRGNVGIISGGSLYSGTIVDGHIAGKGYILNSSGITFNSSSADNVTTISSDTGLFTTIHANIGGWNINSNEIWKLGMLDGVPQGRISLNSTQGYIAVSSDNVANTLSGINSAKLATDNVFWSGGSGPRDSGSPFRVTLAGDLYASNANISGTVKATGGGFGTFNSNGTVKNGWQINANGIEAINDTENGGYGRITIGDYSIQSNNSSDFVIIDNIFGTEIIQTNTTAAAQDPKRIFLGDISRQVEVAKSASLSGNGTTATVENATSTQLGAYRSGGLRNIFTVASGQLSSDGSGNILEYPSAIKGDMLVVYDPGTPGNVRGWKSIVGIYINNKDLPTPVNTIAPAVTPTSGSINITQFSTTNGTWTSDSAINYTYEWKYNDQGSVWIPAPGTNNLSTYTPPESWDIDIYGSSLKCYVTATNDFGPTIAPSNTVTLSSNPVIIDGPYTFVTDTSVTVTFAAANTQSWEIYGGGPILLGSGNGSYGDASQTDLSPGTGYSYNVRIYSGLNQTGTYVDVPISTTTTGTSTTQYTVTWSASLGSVTPQSETVDAGQSVTVPLASRTGYANNEWWDATTIQGALEFLTPGQSYVPTSNKTFYAQWVANAAPSNITRNTITPSTGTAGSTQYSSNTGDWDGSPTPTYSYQWKFNDQGSLWVSISGATSSTYTPPSNYTSVYGSELRCYVTATNSQGSSTVYNSNTTTVSAPIVTPDFTPTPSIIDGPYTFATDTSVTITFAAANTASWAIYRFGGSLINSGNGSYGDATETGLNPSTNYFYEIKLYTGANQTGSSVSSYVDRTTSASGPSFPFFPPYFTPPFFPPSFGPKFPVKCIYAKSQILTPAGYVNAEDLKVGDIVLTVDPNSMTNTSELADMTINNNINFIQAEIVKSIPSKKALIKFNNSETMFSLYQPIFIKSNDRVEWKNTGDIEVGDILVNIDHESGNVYYTAVDTIEIFEEDYVYDIRTSNVPWFIVGNNLVVS